MLLKGHIPIAQRSLSTAALCPALASARGCCSRIRRNSEASAPLVRLVECHIGSSSAVRASTTAGSAIALDHVHPQAEQQQQAVRPRHHAHDAEGRLMLKSLTLPELEDWCESVGEQRRRAKQLWRWLFADGRWATDLAAADGTADAFSAAMKAKVAAAASLSGGLQLQSAHTARDGTHKLVFKLLEGQGSATGSVETVLIPRRTRAGVLNGYTACLSTQVGCAQNCQFCLTGRMGLLGNLTTAQIVEQVVAARRWFAQHQEQQQFHEQQQGQQQESSSMAPSSSGSSDEGNCPASTSHSRGSSHADKVKTSSSGHGKRSALNIGNIVFMGMGEPLHNMSALMPALDILTHQAGLGLSHNKIIVSTVGLVPEMRALHATGKAKLAVSLHATSDEVRSWIVPTNRRHSLSELISALEELYPRHLGKGDDFVVIEYVMLAGVNDTEADAQRLLELTERIYCMLNLIAFNPHEGTRFRRSSDERMRAFRAALTAGGRVCTLRLSKGDDEMAACGQLGNLELSIRPAPILAPPPQLRQALGMQ